MKRVSSVLGLGVLSISLAAPLFKLSEPTHPLVASAFRLTVAGILWIPWFLYHLKPTPTQTKNMLRIGVLGALCYAIHFGSWVWSLSLTSTTASVTLVTTTPLMLGVVGWITQKDAPHPALWKGMGWASGGVITLGLTQLDLSFSTQVLDISNSSESFLGYFLALLGGMAMAVYLWLVRSVQHHLHLPLLSLILTLGGGGLLWISCLIMNIPIVIPSQQAFWALVGAACIPQLIGHTALTWSLKYATPTEVGLATVAEPVGASLCTWLIFSEIPLWGEGLGSALILIGIYTVIKTEAPNSAPSMDDSSTNA